MSLVSKLLGENVPAEEAQPYYGRAQEAQRVVEAANTDGAKAAMPLQAAENPAPSGLVMSWNKPENKQAATQTVPTATPKVVTEPTATPKVVTEPTEAEKSLDAAVAQQNKTYGDMLGMLKRRDDDLAAKEKREKRNRMFNSIGEGLSSLANIYFTTKGAPNMAGPSMSAASKARLDKLEADRLQNMKWMQEVGDKINNFNYAAARDKMLNERAKAKDKAAQDAANRKNDMDQWRMGFELAKFEYQKAKDEGNRRLAKQKFKEMQEYHNKMLGIQAVRAAKSGSGSKKEYDMHAVNEYWETLSDEDKRKYAGKTYGSYTVTNEMKQRAYDTRPKDNKPAGY